MRKEIICGLDLGTSKISVSLGQFVEENKLRVLARRRIDSEGMERGKVTDVERLTQAIEGIMHSVGADRDFVPSRIILGIGNDSLKIQHSRRSLILSQRGEEIKASHIDRLIKEAIDMTIPFDHELLHIFPKEFSVDNQPRIRDPRGMFGNRLSGEFIIISIPSSILYNLKKCVYNAGYDIDRVIFSGLASASAFLDREEINRGVFFLKMGGGITTAIKFMEGIPLHIEIFPFGGIDIDITLSKALGISLDTVREVKEKYGSLYKEIPFPEIILEKLDRKIRQKKLQEIIKKVFERYLSQIRRRLEGSALLECPHSGIVLGGGSFLLEGIVEKVEEIFHFPTRLGVLRNIEDYTGEEDQLYSLADSIGLIYFEHLFDKIKEDISEVSARNPLQKIISQTKKILQEYF